MTRYWLWIISDRAEGLWDFCVKHKVAAMQYEIGVQKRAKLNRDIAARISIGDKVVAYLGKNQIGGVGRVTKEFYDDDSDDFASSGGHYGQRIGVEWIVPEGEPLDIRSLPKVKAKIKELRLWTKTIHEIDAETYEEIAAAVRWQSGGDSVPLISSLAEYIAARGFHFPRELLVTFYLSLQTKPFVILTGISGTGKTKLAQLFAEWMNAPADEERRYAFVSVRPDWTDCRGLLGFHNLITGRYQSTNFLRLLVRAAVNLTTECKKPYFVILDEMNLAKVEYYFADFLSAMESRLVDGEEIKQEPLRLHNLPRCLLAQGERAWRAEQREDDRESHLCVVCCDGCPLSRNVEKSRWNEGSVDYAQASQAGFDPGCYVPPRLDVPLNIYFAGTVNVDETTYMFSPKVLDRANTIEFDEVNLGALFAEPVKRGDARYADETIVEAFTYHHRFIRLPKEVPQLRTEPALDSYRRHLANLNGLLKPYNMHFGYRVAEEILLYLWNAHVLSDQGFDLSTAFDYQIYQKILPKFHGSKAKLYEPLQDLLRFCIQPDNPHGVKDGALEEVREFLQKGQQVEESLSQPLAYPRAARKVCRMLDALDKEGFASFA